MPLSSKAPDLDDTEPGRRDVMQNVLSDEDLVRPGLRRDAGRDVDRPAEVVALVVDHRPRVHTDVRRRQTGWPNAVHDLERRHHRIARILEVEDARRRRAS